MWKISRERNERNIICLFRVQENMGRPQQRSDGTIRAKKGNRSSKVHGRKLNSKNGYPMSLSHNDFVQYLVKKLEETKTGLIYNTVRTIGKGKAYGIFKKAEYTEKSGGLMCANGNRRTKGGVFFTLLKEVVTPDEFKAIYANELEHKRKHKHALKRMKKIREAQNCGKFIQTCDSYSKTEGPVEEGEIDTAEAIYAPFENLSVNQTTNAAISHPEIGIAFKNLAI